MGPAVDRRLRHEVAMLERLRGVERVAQLLDEPRYPGSIVLADAGGNSLAGLEKPLAVDELIELAVELTGAVARIHRRGVMHRDISPANIVISPATGGHVWWASAWRRRSRGSSGVHPPHPDRGDAGLSGPGADRADRAVGGSAG